MSDLSKAIAWLKSKSAPIEEAAAVAETVDPALAPESTIVDEITSAKTPAPAVSTTLETRVANIESAVTELTKVVSSLSETANVISSLITDVKSFNALKAVTDGELLIADVEGEAPAIKVAINDILMAISPK